MALRTKFIRCILEIYTDYFCCKYCDNCITIYYTLVVILHNHKIKGKPEKRPYYLLKTTILFSQGNLLEQFENIIFY